jgi:hypothetical protein
MWLKDLQLGEGSGRSWKSTIFAEVFTATKYIKVPVGSKTRRL